MNESISDFDPYLPNSTTPPPPSAALDPALWRTKLDLAVEKLDLIGRSEMRKYCTFIFCAGNYHTGVCFKRCEPLLHRFLAIVNCCSSFPR